LLQKLAAHRDGDFAHPSMQHWTSFNRKGPSFQP
jgi:hypothetical protein